MANLLANEQALAVAGGEKLIASFEGKNHPKVGLDEFMSLAKTWGYSTEAQAKIRDILEPEADTVSPQLTRYYHPGISQVDELEKYARELFNSEYALGVNSGTSALVAAYVACGIGPGDEVIVPGYTFFATAAAVVAARGIPVIAEIDDSLTLDPADVAKKITPRTKAIVPVHMGGICCDMDAIMALARKHNLIVIEDNAQACGGTYNGQMLGSIGNLGCFSLSSYKISGAGEAGMVLTNDEWLYTRAQNQHDTAACWRPDRYAKERRPGELFCGQNYRMSELEGSVNLIQLQKTRDQAKRYNTNHKRITQDMDTFRDTTLRRSNDAKGDVGYNFALFAKDAHAATKLSEALVAEGVPSSARGEKSSRDWHLYCYWDQILEHKTPTAEGCPYTCSAAMGPLPEYSRDMCQSTLDLVARTVFVSVNQWWSEKDCGNVAAAINKVCHVLG